MVAAFEQVIARLDALSDGQRLLMMTLDSCVPSVCVVKPMPLPGCDTLTGFVSEPARKLRDPCHHEKCQVGARRGIGRLFL